MCCRALSLTPPRQVDSDPRSSHGSNSSKRKETALAQHYQVVRYDMRGFGRSTLPNDAPYSHVRDMLDRLNIGQVYLVGLSMGGGVALDFEKRILWHSLGL